MSAPEWERLRKSVRGYLGARNLKPEHAEDLTQSTLLRLLERVEGGEALRNPEGAAFRESDHARYRERRSRKQDASTLAELSPVMDAVRLPWEDATRGRPTKGSPRRRQPAVIFRPDGSVALIGPRKAQIKYLIPPTTPKTSLIYVLRVTPEGTILQPWSAQDLRHVTQALDRLRWSDGERAIRAPRKR